MGERGGEGEVGERGGGGVGWGRGVGGGGGGGGPLIKEVPTLLKQFGTKHKFRVEGF